MAAPETTNPWAATDEDVVVEILTDVLARVRDGATLWVAINCARFNAYPRKQAGTRATDLLQHAVDVFDRDETAPVYPHRNAAVVEYALRCARTPRGEGVQS